MEIHTITFFTHCFKSVPFSLMEVTQEQAGNLYMHAYVYIILNSFSTLKIYTFYRIHTTCNKHQMKFVSHKINLLS